MTNIFTGINFTGSTQTAVAEFQTAFNHPVADKPTALSKERATVRSIWTAEECVELIAASCTNKEDFARFYYQFEEGVKKAFLKSLEDEFPQTEEEIIVGQTDAVTDIEYFVNGTAVEMGINLESYVQIVHDANMSKLFTDEEGNKYAKYREEDGKVLKSPEFYQPEPYIIKELQRAGMTK